MRAAQADRRAFVLANTRLRVPPLVPELRLRLADEAVPIWKKTEEELGAMGLPPPFWAFAWAGGQALARYALDNPALVSGKRVLDFASGSGLAAIAAALAGAAAVEASDIDPFAVAAIEANAAENRVAVTARHEDLTGADEGWDVVLAGDVAYEKAMAEAATDWLARLVRRGATVLIGDPRRAYLALDRLTSIVEYRVPVTRELEDAEIKRTGVFRFRSSPLAPGNRDRVGTKGPSQRAPPAPTRSRRGQPGLLASRRRFKWSAARIGGYFAAPCVTHEGIAATSASGLGSKKKAIE
jgi:predicted nicotinamide N-methyase